MQIVIDISKERYEEYKLIGDSRDILFEAIRKGTVLPEHHGDLVDRSSYEYLKTLHDAMHDAIHGKMSWSDAILKIKYSAPTIIPATKEDCDLTDCKCNDNGKCNDGLAYKESCYDCYIPATKEDTIGKFVDALFFGESATKEKICKTCAHKNDDFDCHNFCVPYDFDHYIPTTKGEENGDRN